MTKLTELAIRARVAIQYPSWRLDFTDPTTVVLTNMMGQRRMLTFQRRRKRYDGPLMRLARWGVHRLCWIARQVIDATEWIVPAVIWLLGMWMVAAVMLAWVLGGF